MSEEIREPIKTSEGLKEIIKNGDEPEIKEFEELNFPEIFWPFPPKPLEYGSKEELFKELEAFFNKFAEFPDERHYKILASFVLSTYLKEDFDFAVQLGLVGPHETGKTRVLRLLSLVAHRAKLLVYSNSAPIYRLIENYNATLLLDEAESLLNNSNAKQVINSGYKRGLTVPKADGPNFEVSEYSSFGPKAFSTTESTKYPTTESRIIRINMRQAEKDLPILIDEDWAAELRGKLLKFRLDNSGEYREKEPSLTLDSHRVKEIMFPLLVISEEDPEIVEFAKELDKEKIRERKETIKAKILEGMGRALDDNYLVTPDKIREELDQETTFRLGNNTRGQNIIIGKVLKDLGFNKYKVRTANGMRYKLGQNGREELIKFLKQYNLEDIAEEA